MPLSQLRNSNFGKRKGYLTGSSGVGFTILSSDGSIFQARTTAGVYEEFPGSGLYAAFISFPDAFHGSIVWDTGEALLASRSFATEQYNVEENDPKVATNNLMLQQLTGSVNTLTGSMATALANIQFLVDMEGGRWRLDPTTNQMIFYKADNTTVVAKFNLFDINGNPTIDQVTERQRV